MNFLHAAFIHAVSAVIVGRGSIAAAAARQMHITRQEALAVFMSLAASCLKNA